MGEIKSTIDLVMEKTKHLTLSQEERKEQQYVENKKVLKGLLQKFLDHGIKIEHLKKELDNLKKNYGLNEKNLLLDEILEELQFDRDNRLLLILLDELFSFNTLKIESLLEKYRDTLRSMGQKRQGRVKENLAKEHFISGSAVAPNLETDEVWKTEAQGVKDKFNQMLSQEKTGLAAVS